MINRTRSPKNVFPVSRRDFLWTLTGSLLCAGISPGAGTAAQTPSYPFVEVPPAASGIHWVHTAGKSPEHYLPETTGAGCAFLDYDNDGWMDIYLVNSGKCDFFDPNPPLRNALYRNNRDGTFSEVTGKAGVAGGGYGQGVAVGDYNGDGFPDIYVTQYGRNILYHNNGDGTFTDVTEKAGVAAPGWSSSAVWFDYDNDGKLDLFVCQFVEFSKAQSKDCRAGEDAKRGYCIPHLFKPTPSWLFHNNGDGTFTDVSKTSGIAGYRGKAWGVVAADINNDGDMDLFVANDTVQNFLFANRGSGKWEEISLAAEVAFSESGQPRSGMGVDAADVFGSGYQDLFVANVDQEMFSLYRNQKNESFRDVAPANGVAQATRLLSGWGLKFFDYDNDGAVDLILANGHPDDMIESYSPAVKHAEPLVLFHQDGGKLRNVTGEAGPAFERRYPARGLAIGDFNNDGRSDVLIAMNGGPPLLLENRSGRGNHWLGLKLEGATCNRDAIGARIRWSAGGIIRSRFKNNGGSYLSSHDPREILGIGKAERIDWIEITWPKPSSRIQRLQNPKLDRYMTVREL